MRYFELWVFLVLAGVVAIGVAAETPEIAGVTGVNGSDDAAWMAVRLDMPENYALAGFLWYNNDSQVTYPQLLVGTGHTSGPGDVAAMVALAGPFAGGSDAWSELELDQPVAASLGALYLVFELPAEAEFTGRGAGGGPALGYFEGTAGAPGWISGDGQTWLRLADTYSFALEPQFVPLTEGMLVKSLGAETQDQDLLPREPYLTAGPNPFNPRTELRFGLTQAAATTIAVYDIRGRRVVPLVSEVLPAGHHTVTWTGSDNRGRGVASEVYFVKLDSGRVHKTQRLLLLR